MIQTNNVIITKCFFYNSSAELTGGNLFTLNKLLGIIYMSKTNNLTITNC